MNVLDENILESQRQLLISWRIPVRQIGVELAQKGILDENVLPFLLSLTKPTFFTRDLGFSHQVFCHPRRCIVVLAVGQYEVAHFVRRVLKHPSFKTQKQRMGSVIRVSPTGLLLMKRNLHEAIAVDWLPDGDSPHQGKNRDRVAEK